MHLSALQCTKKMWRCHAHSKHATCKTTIHYEHFVFALRPPKFLLSGNLKCSLYTLCIHHAHTVLAHVHNVMAMCSSILGRACNVILSTLLQLLGSSEHAWAWLSGWAKVIYRGFKNKIVGNILRAWSMSRQVWDVQVVWTGPVLGRDVLSTLTTL